MPVFGLIFLIKDQMKEESSSIAGIPKLLIIHCPLDKAINCCNAFKPGMIIIKASYLED